MGRPRRPQTSDLGPNVWPDRSVKDRRLTVRLPLLTLERLRAEAEDRGTTMNDLVLSLVSFGLESWAPNN